ncbi:MAG: hypothetical protein ABIJ50_13425 [Pseudomonadota bacterium]
MYRKICLFLTLASTVPILSFAATSAPAPNFQEGQTTVPQMRQYFEGRKAEYNQYLADLAAYNQAIADQQAWDIQKNQEDQTQQQTQAILQAAIDQKSQECSQYQNPAEQQACQQTVTDMQTQMYEQAADYAAYRQAQDGTRPVVGQQPTFYDNTAELDKAYIFDGNQVLEEKVNIVGERNMKDSYTGRTINNEDDIQDYYHGHYDYGQEVGEM